MMGFTGPTAEHKGRAAEARSGLPSFADVIGGWLATQWRRSVFMGESLLCGKSLEPGGE